MRVSRVLSPSVMAPLVVVAAALVQFRAALLGRVYRFEDIAAYFEPLWTAAARAMQAGRWPIWDDGAWSGQPLLGDPQIGVFYPPNWAWLAMPVLHAYSLSVALHAAAAGLGMYALARLRGRSHGAAAAAGIALGIGGFVVLQARHVMFVQATAWTVILAACAWRWLDPASRGRAALVGAALATGMLFLTGGVSMIYYGAWFLAALLGPRALSRNAGAASARTGKLAGLCIAAIVGLLLAAPSLLPAAAHAKISPRALGTDYTFAASVAWSGWHYLPTLFLPNAAGQEVLGTYRGGGTQWELCGYYAGMISFALAMYALVAGPRERRAERIALGCVLLLAVLLAPGARSPVHHAAYELLPLYDAMRCPARALYVFSLAVPLLAADGIDLAAPRLQLLLQRSNSVAAKMLQRNIGAAFALLVALDLFITHRAENPSTTLAEAHAETFPDVGDFLRARPDSRFVNDVHLSHALHNAGLLWGVSGASGYSSLPIWRYLDLLYEANHGAPYPHARLAEDLAAQGIWRFDSDVVDLLAIRWVLAPRSWEMRAPGFEKRIEGRAGRAGIDIWENTEALPRAWLVDGEEAHEAARSVRRPARFSAVSDYRVGPTDREARVEAAGDSLLVFAEPHHPNWRATVDGQPAPIEITHRALVGVRVPRGAHVVALRMTSPELDRGLGLARLGAIGLVALALVGRGRRRAPTDKRLR